MIGSTLSRVSHSGLCFREISLFGRNLFRGLILFLIFGRGVFATPLPEIDVKLGDNGIVAISITVAKAARSRGSYLLLTREGPLGEALTLFYRRRLSKQIQIQDVLREEGEYTYRVELRKWHGRRSKKFRGLPVTVSHYVVEDPKPAEPIATPEIQVPDDFRDLPLLSLPCNVEFRSRLIEALNLVRLRNSLLTLLEDADLTSGAQTHSYWMAERAKDISHDGWAAHIPNFDQFRAAAQTIAATKTDPEDVVEGWLQSPPHREVLLATSYERLGVGCAVFNGSFWWTANFATRR